MKLLAQKRLHLEIITELYRYCRPATDRVERHLVRALLNHRTGRVGGAGAVVVDLARFIRIEPALPGSAHLVGHASDRVGANSAVHLLAWRVGEGVAAAAATGQVVIDRLLTAALRRASQGRQVLGISQ